ncbi:DNA adenine methylase [Paraburkholderia sediminicola]|uniref:DNA adenine methylase n=1 Tax=Paraburkholderia sediminicola TaxID=458836 RepID=UPI0038B86115
MRTYPAPQAKTPLRPLLKWAGGKSRLLSHILPALPAGQRLLEPFVGGASVFLGSNFEQYVLGDNNHHLIELYRAVAEHPCEFIERTSEFLHESYRTATRFQEVRALFNRETDPLARASYFLYLNKFGFNGLCRYNGSGQFNVPYGKPDRVPRLPRDEILGFASKAESAQIIAGDFTEIMLMARPGDTVYCDPPYLDRDGAASFRAYGAAGFSLDRQQELANLARQLAGQGISVAISNHDCAHARELYEGASISTFSARRSISAAAGSRGEVSELLAVFGPTFGRR